jgi:1-aminocyclopropane-1-carboxylate deaminase
VVKGAEFLDGEVARLQREALGAPTANWSVRHDFHFGGYARSTAELAGFIADFRRRHGIELDRVYVAKMMCGIFTLAERKTFRPGTRLVAVITGPSA